MKKSEKPRNRYILFEVQGEIQEGKTFENWLYKEVLRFFGEFGFSSLGFKVIEYYSKNKKGIVRCSRDSKEKMIGFMSTLENPRVKTLKTSGTIKTLREILSR